MRHLRSAALAALVLGTLITSAGTALAAAPGNDTADGVLGLNMSSSTYSAAAIVAIGSPGNFSVATCGFNQATWRAFAGTTYTVMVFDDQFDGGGNGGTLNLTIEVVTPPTMDITVNPAASFNSRTGSATVSGTATCTGEPDSAFLQTTLTQQAGRFTVRGRGSSDILCDSTPRSWSVEVLPDAGKFAGGKAASVTNAIACGPFECGVDSEERTIVLRGQA
jgi:hypothetical protein